MEGKAYLIEHALDDSLPPDPNLPRLITLPRTGS
jgi:hypothetical protein